VHNQRVGGRVRQHHVAELGAISPAALDAANTVEVIVARRAAQPRKSVPRAKAAAMSKEAQIRALRERDVQ